MTAQEVRIGNLLYGTNGVVSEVNIDAIKYLLTYGNTNQCQAKPIPLTEDWLKRFGFGRLGKYSFRTKHLIIHHRKRGFVINKKIREIQYVHELQNIYWALFNTELTPSDGGKIE